MIDPETLTAWAKTGKQVLSVVKEIIGILVLLHFGR
jgi:hypothetical protein